MIMTKRDVTGTILVLFGVCCFLAVAFVVAAVHVGFIASPFKSYDAAVLTNKG